MHLVRGKPKELRGLQGSSAGAVADRTRLAAWRDFHRHVKPLSEVDPEHFPGEVFTLRALLWARCTCTTRAFPLSLVSGCLEHADATFILCPLLDSFNHRAGAEIEWRVCADTSDAADSGTQASGVEFRLPKDAQPLSQGAEIWNDYGPKSNEDLLLNFGFCENGNRHDRVEMLARATGPLPALRARAAELRNCGVSVAFSPQFELTAGPFRLQLEAVAEEGEPDDIQVPAGMLRALAPAPGASGRAGAPGAPTAAALQRLLRRLPRPGCGAAGRGAASRRRAAACRVYVEGQRRILAAAIRKACALAADEPQGAAGEFAADGTGVEVELVFLEEDNAGRDLDDGSEEGELDRGAVEALAEELEWSPDCLAVERPAAAAVQLLPAGA